MLRKDILELKEIVAASVIQKYVRNILNENRTRALASEWMNRFKENQVEQNLKMKEMSSENEMECIKLSNNHEENTQSRLKNQRARHEDMLRAREEQLDLEQANNNRIHLIELENLQKTILDRHVQEMYMQSTEHRSKIDVLEETVDQLRAEIITEHSKYRDLKDINTEQLALATNETTFEVKNRVRSESETFSLLQKLNTTKEQYHEKEKACQEMKKKYIALKDEEERNQHIIGTLQSNQDIQQTQYNEELLQLRNRNTSHVEMGKKEREGKFKSKRSEHREWSTVVDISIPPPSFKPVSLYFSRSPLF